MTSPGRQNANRSALERSLSRGTPKLIRFVTPHEEARLAYAGAVSCAPSEAGNVAVCDVGGGSTEIAIGAPTEAPAWCRSFCVPLEVAAGGLREGAALTLLSQPAAAA